MTTEVSEAGHEDGRLERTADQPWYRAAARGGWVARGLLFILTAVLALQLGLGQRREEASSQGAMEEVAQKPFGKALLLVLAVGLLAYAGWRLVEIFLNRSQDSAWTARVKHLAHAAVYLALSGMALATLRSPNGQSGGGQQQGITARVLSWPGGTFLVGAVGVAVFATGVGIAWHVLQRRHREELELDEMARRQRRLVDLLAMAGNAGRALVFCLVGWFVVVAAVRNDPRQANGLDAALHELLQQPYGSWMLGVVATGLALYGAFCLVSARCHRM
ncbi:MAG TPA: DUF1206 domain-containing protein [Acidimicrobiales bacterium]|nr:DUF1206 domain-containing protein [Acidimicrobiales bacterium]